MNKYITITNFAEFLESEAKDLHNIGNDIHAVIDTVNNIIRQAEAFESRMELALSNQKCEAMY